MSFLLTKNVLIEFQFELSNVVLELISIPYIYTFDYEIWYTGFINYERVPILVITSAGRTVSHSK